MYTFDASSVIHGWYFYPIENFPGLWAWFALQTAAERFSMSEVAFQEVSQKEPECGKWLKDVGKTKTVPLSNSILQSAIQIKNLLNIRNDNYHAKGVGENDLFIIAAAKLENLALVSEEAKQSILPQILSKYKIPAVCSLPGVSVKCLSFLELIKNENPVF